ncbi:MAG: RagB/SusD family nutrient uptake outer membrane protein [Bacteroidetes bacterium HGW-Bacteroidetes-17]|jgi:hypothetical protein|nr:MAG: RagB/SusD family nutrient uptake outer membrane protein [Bacteroidetes bacterium HGW-Bacteroidetes-17]
MKKIIYSFIIIFTAGILLTSCEKDFLATYPTDAVSANAVTLTTANMWASINGIHRRMYYRFEEQGLGGIGSWMIQMDQSGEDLVQNASQWYRQIYRWEAQANPTHYYNYFVWRMFYQYIANVNILINQGENAVGPQTEKDAIIGQALVYRAWSHFNIVRVYAKRYEPGGANSQLGIPYMLENLTEGQTRNTVAEVYTNILADLDAAIVKLAGFNAPNKSHITVDAAKGIKARVALTMGNYALAAQLAAEVKANYELMDMGTYANGFRINSQGIDEFIWASQITSVDQNDKWAAYGAYVSRNMSSSAIRSNPYSINSTLYAKISATDVRKGLWSPDGKHSNLQAGVTLLSSHKKFPYTNQKFIAVDNADSRVDVPLMRAAEMYLIEAEAKARQGQDAAAAQVLYDLVITRDPDYTKSTNTGAALIDEIMTQRRVELWGEGFRWLDLKRLNLPLDRTGANHQLSLAAVMEVSTTDNRWTWLIPQKEMDSNPNMVQNDL